MDVWTYLFWLVPFCAACYLIGAWGTWLAYGRNPGTKPRWFGFRTGVREPDDG